MGKDTQSEERERERGRRGEGHTDPERKERGETSEHFIWILIHFYTSENETLWGKQRKPHQLLQITKLLNSDQNVLNSYKNSAKMHKNT